MCPCMACHVFLSWDKTVCEWYVTFSLFCPMTGSYVWLVRTFQRRGIPYSLIWKIGGNQNISNMKNKGDGSVWECLTVEFNHYIAQMASNSKLSSCFSLLSAGTTDVYHHTWQIKKYIYIKDKKVWRKWAWSSRKLENE